MIELVATCMFGLEKALGEEIDALGCKRIETIDDALPLPESGWMLPVLISIFVAQRGC